MAGQSDTPAYRVIADELRREFSESGRDGQRVASARQLARRFSVSAGTVNHAITVLASEGIVEQRPRSGNFLARLPDNRHVAVLLEIDLAHPRTTFSARYLAQEITRRLIARGWQVRLYTGHLPPDHHADTSRARYSETTCPAFLEAVLQRRLRGVVAIESDPLEQWMEPLRRQGVPVVGMADDYDCGVQHDLLGMIHAGVRRLAQRGCRRVALMQWAAPMPYNPASDQRRWHAFVSALNEAGIPVHMPHVRSDLCPTTPGAGWEGFREIWSSGPVRPDGLLVLDDNLMRDAVSGILACGVAVPGDLAIVSLAVRGSGIAHAIPVDEMVVEVGDIAEAHADLLDRRLRGEAVEQPRRRLPHTWRYACPPNPDLAHHADAEPPQSGVGALKP